jgi:hypothetical protein
MIYKTVIAVAILSCSLSGVGYAQESAVVLRQGEALNDFGTRIIPNGMKLAHNVVKGDFGSAKENIVVLFHKGEFEDYIGWVLAPDGAGYKKYTLPSKTAPVSTEVEAVFFANIDSDPDRELLILCKHISGVGRYPGNITPFWTVYAYDWNGGEYKYLEDIPDEFVVQREYRTVQSIRNRLKQLGY